MWNRRRERLRLVEVERRGDSGGSRRGWIVLSEPRNANLDSRGMGHGAGRLRDGRNRGRSRRLGWWGVRLVLFLLVFALVVRCPVSRLVVSRPLLGTSSSPRLPRYPLALVGGHVVVLPRDRDDLKPCAGRAVIDWPREDAERAVGPEATGAAETEEAFRACDGGLEDGDVVPSLVEGFENVVLEVVAASGRSNDWKVDQFL